MNDRTDVSYVGGLFGGGGHRNASGMGTTTLVDHMPGRILDEYRAYDMLQYVYQHGVENNNYLLLNTPVMKTAFARYLMQERFIGERDGERNKTRVSDGLPGYQEGMFVMRQNRGDNDLDEAYQGAVCWNLDGNTDRFHITFAPLSTRVKTVRQFVTEIDRIQHQELGDDRDGDYPFECSENKGVFYISFDGKSAYSSPQEFLDHLTYAQSEDR